MTRNVQTQVSLSQIHRSPHTKLKRLARAAQNLAICIKTEIGYYSLTFLISISTFCQRKQRAKFKMMNCNLRNFDMGKIIFLI